MRQSGIASEDGPRRFFIFEYSHRRRLNMKLLIFGYFTSATLGNQYENETNISGTNRS